MTTTAAFSAGTLITRQFVAQMAGIALVMPACKNIFSSTPNAFDEVTDAGLPVPDAAPTTALSSTGITGTDLAYYITSYDERTDTRSNPSAQSASLSPSNQGILLTFADTNLIANRRVTHREIWRNTTGSSIYHFVARVAVATPTYLDQATDATISANDAMELDNDAPVANSYGFAHVDRNFMILGTPYNTVGGTDYDDKVLHSKVGNPDAYRPINLTTYLKGRKGPIRAITSSGGSVLLAKDVAQVEWGYDLNPHLIYGDGNSVERSIIRGCINQRTLANIEGLVFFMDREGIYLYTGGTRFLRLSTKLEKAWQRINWSVKERFSATWDDDFVYFVVALDNDEECHWALAFDLHAFWAQQEPRWYPFYYDFDIRDTFRWNTGGGTAADYYGIPHRTLACFMTKSGHAFAFNCGYRDGVSYNLTAEATLTGAQTTTVLTASAGVFSATNGNGDTVNAAGCYVRFVDNPSLPGAYLIASCTATTLTLDSALPVAPTAGDEIVIGAIDYELETPKTSFGTPHLRKPGAIAHFEFEPRAVNHDVRAEFECDGFAPQNNAETRPETEYTATEDKPYIELHMGGDYTTAGGRQGAVTVPVGTRGFAYLKARLKALGVDMPAQFNALALVPLTPTNEEMQ